MIFTPSQSQRYFAMACMSAEVYTLHSQILMYGTWSDKIDVTDNTSRRSPNLEVCGVNEKKKGYVQMEMVIIMRECV